MDQDFWHLSLGNILTLATVVVAFLNLRLNQKRDQEENRRRLEIRHDQNIELMNSLKIQLASLSHLDTCFDTLRAEVNELRNHFMNFMRKPQ